METTAEVPAPAAPTTASPHQADAIKRSWPVDLTKLRANLSHETDEARDLFLKCFLWCVDQEHPRTLHEFAAGVNRDHTTILRICHGTYTNFETKERIRSSEEFMAAMRAWLILEEERLIGKRPAVAMTPTLKRIWSACDLARESQSPVFIIGPSHVGKSVGLDYYAGKNNHGRTVYVRLRAANGLGGMIKDIARAIGGIGLKANTATLIESIKSNLTPNTLLILDEVHQLLYTYRKESFFACLEVVREIYDACQCGMVLCGTSLLFKRMDENRGELEQLLRRGVHKVILPDQPTRGDVTAILDLYGLPFPEKKDSLTVTVGHSAFTEQPYEMLRQVGREEGLKSIIERLRYGQKRAAKLKDKTLKWDHVVWAHFTIKANAVKTNDWN